MREDFSILFDGIINDETIKKQIGKLRTQDVVLENVTINATTLASQIQSELNKHKFEIKPGNNTDSSFNKNSGKAVSDYTKILNISKQISNIEYSKSLLSPSDVNQFQDYEKKLKTLKKLRNELLSKNFGKFSDNQMSSLTEALSLTEDKITHVIAKEKDMRRQFAKEIKYKINTGEIDLSISNASKKYATLSSMMTTVSLGTADSDVKNKMDSLEKDFALIKELKKIIDTPGANSNVVVETYERLDTVLHRVNNTMKIVENSQDAITSKSYQKAKIEFDSGKFSAEIAKLEAKYNELEKLGGADLTKLRQHINDVKEANSRMANTATTPNEFVSAWNQATDSLDRAKNAMKEAGASSNSLTAVLKRGMDSVKKYALSYFSLSQVITILKQMYQNVVMVDDAMVNLKKVTDETPESYSKFMKQAMGDSRELGRTASSYIEQTASWAKLGYDTNEAAQLAKISSVYANVGELNDDEAVSDIVTALKAFNIAVEDGWVVADALNELGNRFATSAADLGDGLSVSASSMAMAGNDIHQTLAMLTGMSEITQNANESGNALKIFTMRIRGMKGELEQLGEEVDPTVDSISKVQTQILNFTKGKVNIFNADGSFREYYEIMEDIAAIWNELEDVDQSKLSEVLFGKQRANQGAALIQAFQSGQIQKAYNVSANESEGSAMEEQEKWMDSLTAKTEQLKNAFEALATTFLNSDSTKDFIDLLIGLLDVITSLIDTFGSLNTVIMGFAGYGAIKSIS